MEPLTESQVRPQFGKFRLKATGEHDHEVRKMTVDDRAWFQDTFKVPVEEALKNGLPEKDFMRLIYRLIVDKSVFKPREITEYDEDGNEKKVSIGGVRLFMTMIEVPKDYGVLTEALTKTVDSSNPPKQPVNEDEKKTEPDPNQLSFVGEKSST